MHPTANEQTERHVQSPPPAFAYAKLPAQNVDRARAFWREAFGLEPYLDRNYHLYYEVGGAHFLVFPSTGAPSGTHDQLGLVVADIESEVARLRTQGVRFEEYPPPPGIGATVKDGIMDRGYMKAGWFKDTEGNLISINEFVGDLPFHR
jgi:catechol 2,3-dioxygenase-like lactoylglutathione lyase family enzyme